MTSQNIDRYVQNIRLLYPIWIIVAIFGVAYVPSQILVQGDIAKTAANISDNEMLFRFSILSSIITQVLHAFIPYYLYLIFKDVNKNRALLMLILALISIPLTLGFDVFKITLLNVTNDNLMYEYLNISQNGILISTIFWGLWLFPLGKLVIESNYLPKLLGYILLVSCFGYILSAVLKICFENSTQLSVFAEALTFGEVIFALWFIIKGMRLDREL